MGERGELLLGIDIGTSSSKGVLVRPDGEIVASATRPHQLSLPRPGWAEHDAETVWWADFTGLARFLADRDLAAGDVVSGDVAFFFKVCDRQLFRHFYSFV